MVTSRPPAVRVARASKELGWSAMVLLSGTREAVDCRAELLRCQLGKVEHGHPAAGLADQKRWRALEVVGVEGGLAGLQRGRSDGRVDVGEQPVGVEPGRRGADLSQEVVRDVAGVLLALVVVE